MNKYLTGIAPSQYMPGAVMCNYSFTHFGGTHKWEEGCAVVTKRGTFTRYSEFRHLRFVDNEILEVRLTEGIVRDANDMTESLAAINSPILESDELISRETTEQDIQHTLQMYIDDRLKHLQDCVDDARSRIVQMDARPRYIGLPHMWIYGMFGAESGKLLQREIWGLEVFKSDKSMMLSSGKEGYHYTWVNGIDHRWCIPDGEAASVDKERV